MSEKGRECERREERGERGERGEERGERQTKRGRPRGRPREADQERQTKRKYIDDILQDNHLEGEWTRVNESQQKSTKVKDSQRRVVINQHSSVLQRRGK